MLKKSILKIESETTILTTWSKKKKLETKNILIDEKNYKGLVIYFTRYVHSKSIKMLSLCYLKLIEKIEKHKWKNTWWLMNIC